MFSKEIVEDVVYETELKNYVENILQLKEYQVIEKEFGVIPMTNRKFSFYENDRYNIGTSRRTDKSFQRIYFSIYTKAITNYC